MTVMSGEGYPGYTTLYTLGDTLTLHTLGVFTRLKAGL